MPIQTYVNALKSSIDLPAINAFFVEKRDLTLEILQKVRSEGRLEGDRFKLASVEGGSGSSFDFNVRSHYWGDWATGDKHFGLVDFLRATLKFSTTQVLSWLKDNKFINRADVIKTLRDNEGDALVFPIPEDVTWESILEDRVLRKDRALITGNWEYRDVDGSLLGFMYRVDDRRTSKEVYTLTLRSESGWVKKPWSKKSLPPYGLQKLGESPNIRVLFVEGEKAADKAQEILGDRWKVLSFSGLTAAADLWLPDDEFWSSVEVVLWPDNDRAGREAMRKIQVRLDKLRHKPREVRVVDVDKISGLPAKWDLGDWEEGCGVDVQFELDNAIQIHSFDYVCKEWVYVSQQDEFHNLLDPDLIWTVTSFDRTYARYGEKASTPSKKFFTDAANLRCDDLDFIPGYGRIIEAGNTKKFLNEWYPTQEYRQAVEIANDPNITDEEIAENAKFFIEHLGRICDGEIVEPDYDQKTKEVIPGTEDRELVDALTWHFAEIVKKPMDKRGWIPMMVSECNGTGKSYFRFALSRVLGANRARTVTVNEFTSEYHDWRDGTLFYELAETKSHDSTEVYEELKKLHSYRPFNPETLMDRNSNADNLNIKSKAKKKQRDFLNGYVTSNHLFPIALANKAGKDTGDRRLLVIRCEEILTEEQSEQLFDDELVHRPEWIGAYLLRFRPKYKWNPSWAPITQHKRKMLEEDRIRSEARNEKYELGHNVQTVKYIQFALSFKEGCFNRKVFTFNQIKDMIESAGLKSIYDEETMTTIMDKTTAIKCDHRVENEKGVSEACWTSSEEFRSAPSQVLAEQIKKKTDEPF